MSARSQIEFFLIVWLVVFAGNQTLVAQSVTCLPVQSESAKIGAANRIETSQRLLGRQGTIQLRGQVEIPGGSSTDVWGYFDEMSQREYALVGGLGRFGLSIIDVTDPSNAQVVSQVEGVPGFDVKAWGHFVYTVTGLSGATLGKIIDIADPTAPQIVGSFDSSHNIFITDDGYMILEGPNLRVLDLNSDPTNPSLLWTGAVGGHDASVINNVLYDFHGGAGTFIYDFTNPANPTLIDAINDPELTFHHQGWTSEDANYLYICDEGSQPPSPDIFVYDISDPTNPQRVGQFGDSLATVHNLFVIGNFAVVSYYSAGFRVLDVSDPVKPALIDEYDTALSTRGGAWGVYPFAPSGLVYVSDIQNGLYLFEVQGLIDSVTNGNKPLPESIALFENYPNPFNPGTRISYQLKETAYVRLNVYNAIGQKVRNLVDEEKAGGVHEITWEGNNDSGAKVPSGIYFYNLKTSNFSTSKRMLLLK